MKIKTAKFGLSPIESSPARPRCLRVVIENNSDEPLRVNDKVSVPPKSWLDNEGNFGPLPPPPEAS